MLEMLPQRVAKMRQVAVKPELQSMGIGSGLVRFSEEWSKQQGLLSIVMHARKEAVPFYERMGYEVRGKEFLEVGIPHFKMEKTLNPKN
jgi:predicted GNAT family N-acyltransferase